MPDLVSDYCTVDGAGIGVLSPLITDAFVAEELEELVRFTFSQGLYEEYVPEGLSGGHLVFTLLNALGRRGTTVIFLRAVRTARSGRPELVAAIARLCPAAANNAPSAKQQVASVLAGLETLKTHAADAAIAGPLRLSRDQLGGLAAGFDRLKSYKALHDCLQQIQIRQYRQLVDDVKRLRTDPLVSVTLDNQLLQLDILSDAAVEGAGGLPDTPLERRLEMRWIRILKTSLIQLREAVAAFDDRAATLAVTSIRDLIRKEPFRVNGLLTATAEGLPLGDLIETIGSVCNAIAANDPSRAKLDVAHQALQNLYPRLRGQVAEHDRWQDVENELWSADQAMDQQSRESHGGLRAPLGQGEAAHRCAVRSEPRRSMGR